MSQSPLQLLGASGQSVWLDFIERSLIHDGRLTALLKDGLAGMTSNPTIFEKALAEGDAYDAQIGSASRDLEPASLFELIETDDVRDACDAFAGVYEATGARDGYVSIEVSPAKAFDAAATIDEAHRLWRTVDRPNVMVKVPGTEQGAVAVKQLVADGVNVNVTLLFSIRAHDRVIEAYLSGLEDRMRRGVAMDRVASVASFFVSRVDTAVDRLLEDLAAKAGQRSDRIRAMRGRAAIANARMAYQQFRNRFAGERWERLAAAGARVQRPLWASTSTKNPAYRDVLYVEQLIGPDTVNTIPPATMDAFRHHGIVARTVDSGVEQARNDLAELSELGIDLDRVTGTLLAEGIEAFRKSFDSLLAGLARKMSALAVR